MLMVGALVALAVIMRVTSRTKGMDDEKRAIVFSVETLFFFFIFFQLTKPYIPMSVTSLVSLTLANGDEPSGWISTLMQLVPLTYGLSLGVPLLASIFG
jgi:hypothetical protein